MWLGPEDGGAARVPSRWAFRAMEGRWAHLKCHGAPLKGFKREQHDEIHGSMWRRDVVAEEEVGEQQQWFGQETKWAGPQGQQERWRKVGLGDIPREPRAGVSDGLETE